MLLPRRVGELEIEIDDGRARVGRRQHGEAGGGAEQDFMKVAHDLPPFAEMRFVPRYKQSRCQVAAMTKIKS
jgi:hypothetical protein